MLAVVMQVFMPASFCARSGSVLEISTLLPPSYNGNKISVVRFSWAEFLEPVLGLIKNYFL
tara:strand:+ start:451 stop:633 length:183 start_codon:yes stop_codon:yes gene_type:complete